MTSGIYMFMTTDGLKYVGRSKNIETRIRQHAKKFSIAHWLVLEQCNSARKLNDLEWDWNVKLNPDLGKMRPYLGPSGRKGWSNLGVQEYLESIKEF